MEALFLGELRCRRVLVRVWNMPSCCLSCSVTQTARCLRGGNLGCLVAASSGICCRFAHALPPLRLALQCGPSCFVPAEAGEVTTDWQISDLALRATKSAQRRSWWETVEQQARGVFFCDAHVLRLSNVKSAS